MPVTTRVIIVVAMVLLTVVSMWTTYVSLHDSILPEPEVGIPLAAGKVWNCSVFALALSVAIGLMLFALKLAIIDEQKRLNILGVVGLTVIAFISISFNMDVLYRTADRSFFIRYSNARMRSVYERYLADSQQALTEKRVQIRKDVAMQQGELQAEIKGLREAPAGYGPRARKEDYHLTVMEKTSLVDLESIDEALQTVKGADSLLRSTTPQTIEEVQKLQDDLRVAVKDVGAYAGISLPEPVKLESPFFAVFQNLFDLSKIGLKEVFFLLIAIFLDLGDIVGYSLVPNKPRKATPRRPSLVAMPDLAGPEFVSPPALAAQAGADTPLLEAPTAEVDGEASPPRRRRGSALRSLRFYRK